ncbi:MAG: DoxX family protein [Flavobacterium sp.]|nr:DoxX family protein [Flavobacterium sp.]
MNNTASALILVFLVITFITSAHDKVFHWNDNVNWLKEHFGKSILKNTVPLSLAIVLFVELLAGILSIIGIVQLYLNGGRTFGFYGAVFSCVALLFLLLGQRLAKDYDGARTIAIYFIPAVMAVFLLS